MKDERLWKAPIDAILPDFIIAGAMKCGTSTVHQIVNSHADVFLPDGEINFFDMDEHLEHSDFADFQDEKWYYPNISDDPEIYWQWYSEFFRNSNGAKILGEDSTTYISSQFAAHRISLQDKPIKIIICIRNPTDMAYSQYWHMLRTGRAMFNFEDTLKYTPHYVIPRSLYRHGICKVLKYIEKKYIHFFILEEYVKNTELCLKKLMGFLELNYIKSIENKLVQKNKTRVPKYIGMQILKNRFFRSYGNSQYFGKMPYKFPENKVINRAPLIISKIHNRINPSLYESIPKMNSNTRCFLNQYFIRENDGLDELVGFDVTNLWFGNGLPK